jgi:hypothetical protein
MDSSLSSRAPSQYLFIQHANGYIDLGSFEMRKSVSKDEARGDDLYM